MLNVCLKEILIDEKDIAAGRNDWEIARMFLGIYKVIGENEEIYFDITHGLRNIPMLVRSRKCIGRERN